MFAPNAVVLGLVGDTYLAVPPTVTVTVSIDCLPSALVMTSSPQRTLRPWPRWTAHRGTVVGTVTTICVSLQLLMAAGCPPIVTVAPLAHTLLVIGAVQSPKL